MGKKDNYYNEYRRKNYKFNPKTTIFKNGTKRHQEFKKANYTINRQLGKSERRK